MHTDPAADRPVAVVTRANRGIGREVVRQLADRDFTVVLGSRDPGRGGRPVTQSVVWAAVLDDDGPTGGCFRAGRPLPW